MQILSGVNRQYIIDTDFIAVNLLVRMYLNQELIKVRS